LRVGIRELAGKAALRLKRGGRLSPGDFGKLPRGGSAILLANAAPLVALLVS